MVTGPVQAECNTRLVSCAELVADPPAVQLPAAFTQHAEVVALLLLQAAGVGGHSSGCQRECLERENDLCRLVAARLGPKNFQSLILSGLGDALHNPTTILKPYPFAETLSICRNNI